MGARRCGGAVPASARWPRHAVSVGVMTESVTMSPTVTLGAMSSADARLVGVGSGQLHRRVDTAMLGNDDAGCHILHVDMDAFFASVELLERPELAGQPVIVGACGPRSVVLSATYEARARGVHSAMPMSRARAACPEAVVLEPRPSRYSELSRHVMTLLRRSTPIVEQISVDEAFLDVTSVRRAVGSGAQIAIKIRELIKAELALPCSVGVAARTHVAKIASTAAKPDGMLVVPVDQQRRFLASLPVGRLGGIGPKAERRLADVGIDRVDQLLAAGPANLARVIGSAAASRAIALAQGQELRPMGSLARDLSIGSEHTFDTDVRDDRMITGMIRILADRVGARLRASGMVGSSISLKIRDANWRTLNRSRSLTAPTDISTVVRDVSLEIWNRAKAAEASIGASPIRLIGVRVEQLRSKSRTGEQLSLDGGAQMAASQAEVVDEVASRFGLDTVVAASRLLAPPGDARPRRVSTGTEGAYPGRRGSRKRRSDEGGSHAVV